jgi:lysophospholipase L1-like esterase
MLAKDAVDEAGACAITAGLWRGCALAGSAAAALLAWPAGAAPADDVPPGDAYVAMGSSFAAGPGVTRLDEGAPARCGRSADNYAHQLARKRKLRLVDVSCSGATTAHILGPWGELAPQLDALTPQTRLVTVTIGGNDVNYIGGLYAASRPGGQAPAAPTEQAWAKVEASLEQIAHEVRRRAPDARLVFVEYVTVLPERGLCAQTPLSEGAAAVARETARRLAQVTAAVASGAGAEDLRVSELSRGHDACASEPWVTGFIRPPGAEHFAAYHPNLAGMTAVAEALDRELRPARRGRPALTPAAAAVRRRPFLGE